MRIASIGEVLWDVIGDHDFLGGAPLNFAVASKRLGNEAVLVSSVGADRRGVRAIQAIELLGLSPEFIEVVPGQETGVANVVTDDRGNATFEIKRPAAFDFLNPDGSLVSRLIVIRPDWVYFGTLAQTHHQSEEILHQLVSSISTMHCFYDLNLREAHWNIDLVQRLSKLASVIKLNHLEAEILYHSVCKAEGFSLETFSRCWSQLHGTGIICITLGERGCGIWERGDFRIFPGFRVKVADTVGAGDAFSGAFVHGLEQGWPMERIAIFANAVGAIVASRAGATPDWTVEECLRMIESAP